MSPVNMCDSRYEILKILKKERCTVEDLSNKIRISPTAVRQHLTILEGESLVRGETLKEGIGRPKVIYTVTEKAEELFPKFYSWLAECLIKEIIDEHGEEKVEFLLQKIGDRYYLLKNHNCSFYKVAQKYPQVCSVHATFLEQLLEQNPERIASMTEGSDYCAYQIKMG